MKPVLVIKLPKYMSQVEMLSALEHLKESEINKDYHVLVIPFLSEDYKGDNFVEVVNDPNVDDQKIVDLQEHINNVLEKNGE